MDSDAVVLVDVNDAGAGSQAPTLAPTPTLPAPNVRPARALIALMALLAAVWGLSSDAGSILIKWALDPLAHSTSNAGSLLLLGAVAIGAGRLALHRAERWSDGRYRRHCIALIAVIMTGHIAVLHGQFALNRSLQLPATVPLYYWQGDQNTYSYVLHTHVGKQALGLIQAFGGAAAGTYDIGNGLAGTLPAWLIVVVAATMLLALVLGYRLLPQVALRHPERAGMWWLFGLGAFNCVKTIADGGPLTYRFLPALVAVLVAIGIAGRRSLWLVAATGTIVSVATWIAISASDAWSAAGAALMLVALFTLCGWHATGPYRRCVWLICAAIAAIGYHAQWLAGPADLLNPLPAGTTVVVADLKTLALHSAPADGLSAAAAYRLYGDDPLKPRRVFLRLPGMADASSLPVLLRVVDGGPPPLRRESVLRVSRASPVPGAAGSALLEVTATDARLPTPLADSPSALTQGNYYSYLHLLAATLRAQGLTEFVLIPTTSVAVREFLGAPQHR